MHNVEFEHRVEVEHNVQVEHHAKHHVEVEGSVVFALSMFRR